MKAFSIITVVKNNKSGIQKTIDSILSQKNISIEHIVIDCKSTDGTSEIVSSYGKKLIHICEKDNGLYDALNKGIAISNGEYIGMLHSNDEFVSNNILKNNYDFLKLNNFDGSFANINIFKKNKLYRVWRYKIKEIKKNNSFMIAHPTLILKKEVYLKYKFKYKVSYQISSDLDFIINLSNLKDLKIMHFDRFLTNCQHGGLSTNILHFKSKFVEDIKILKKHYRYIYFLVYLLKVLSKIKNFSFKFYFLRK